LTKNGMIRISCLALQGGSVAMVVDDEAPPFNPLAFQTPPDLNSLEFISLGGQGIHLLKEFADALAYEPGTTGNRLTIIFNSPGLSPAPI
jgi:sigma-B regulation protein RsbU (phosphoserine phosphatase)